VRGLDRDAEEPGHVPELIGLQVRIAVADDGQRVERIGIGELGRLVEGRGQEAEIEADVVADQRRGAGELQEAQDRVTWRGCPGDLVVRDAVHLGAEDGAAGIDERGEAIDDLAVADADGADLDEIRHLGVTAGRLRVHDHELRATLGGAVDEVEDRIRAGLEVADQLGLARGRAQLVLDVDERLERPVAEQDCVGHDVLGDDRSPGLAHHDRVSRAGDHEIDIRAGQILNSGIDHELAVDATDSDCADGAHERDLADSQGAGSGEGAEHVHLVLLIRGEDGDDDLDVVLVPLGEERPDRAVGQPVGKDGLLGRTRLALDEAARDLARGVHALFELDREREEVQPGPRV